MKEIDIANVMRRLPRAGASPRFKSDVLRNVGRTSVPNPRIAWRMIAATAMMLLLVVGTYAASVHRERQRIKALRAEQQQIKSELRRVKAIAEEVQPVVVLENGDTRVIVDLNQQSNPTYY